MPNDPKQADELRKKINDLKKQRDLLPATDTAGRDAIQKQIDSAQKSLDDLDAQSADDDVPNRPEGQFFTKREVVEMALVGGGGALGGLIACCFSAAGIWQNFVPPGAAFFHCVIAGALAAELTVWFVARTDRNKRVPCFLFSIVCGLAGLQMIEKAAKTMLPDIDFHKAINIAVGATKVNADQAADANALVQNSSTPDRVENAQNKIEKVGDSIKDLNDALTKAKDRGDSDATQTLNKSITDAAQSLTKIKLDSQSIPAVSEKAEEILKKNPEIAKSAEDKELDELKAKYLNGPQTSGWCFLGTYKNGKWERTTTGYKDDPAALKNTHPTLKADNALYLRDAPPQGADYKLGKIVNVFFDDDEFTVSDAIPIKVGDDVRIWAQATLSKRAATTTPSQSNANASTPASTIASPATTPENSAAARRRARRRTR